jgi:hypothetical protein
MKRSECARCSAPFRRWAKGTLCKPCQRLWWQTLGGEYNRYRTWSNNLVRKVIALGWMEPPTALSCHDCEAPATCYDHRDYTKPLAVEAVCESCNTLRGPAIQYAAFREAFVKHHASDLARVKSRRLLWLERHSMARTPDITQVTP